MRFSRSLIVTTKENKEEHESTTLRSHRYLVRGGFIRQVGSGVYDLLPLGKTMLDLIRNVINEELTRAGCLEVSLPFVCPSELWHKSGRFEKYGKELLRFQDRKDQEFVLSPTCEELMVELAKSRISSYRQLPVNIYQINLKFRDEVRPRFGLLRGREFWMKDGYSFHESYEDMLREFHLMEATYKRIFERLGLAYKVVEADSGAIGGSGSKEFMVLAQAGEDTLAICESCEYGANIEAATRKPRVFNDVACESRRLHTPNLKTIKELSDSLSIDPSRFVKAVVKLAVYKEQTKPVAFFVAGDDELEETKALNACGALAFADLTADDALSSGIVLGFTGLSTPCERYIDAELVGRTGVVTGADEIDYHLDGVSVTQQMGIVKDLIAVREGDGCPRCGAPMKYAKGIEVGHIFQLGERYSAPMEAKFLDRNGKSQNLVMGTYGIGVSRLIAAIVEQHSDEKGCVLPLPVAPYQIVIALSNIKDEAGAAYANELYDRLLKAGVRVLFDDRDERYGFKMADFELLGFPFALVVGKNLANGEVELVQRDGLQKTTLPKDDAFGTIISKLKPKGEI